MACADEPDKAILVTGIPVDVNKGIIQLLFKNEDRSGGGEIEETFFSNGGEKAIFIFKDPTVSARVAARGSIPYRNSRLSIHEMVLPEWDQKTIYVTGNTDLSTEKLELVFESKKYSGGGTTESIDIVENDTGALITFKLESDAANVLLKRTITVDQTEVYYVKKPPPKFPVPWDKHSLCITGLPENCKGDDIKVLFEDKTVSGGGPVAHVNFTDNDTKAIIKFRKEEDAVAVLRRRIIRFGDWKLVATEHELDKEQAENMLNDDVDSEEAKQFLSDNRKKTKHRHIAQRKLICFVLVLVCVIICFIIAFLTYHFVVINKNENVNSGHKTQKITGCIHLDNIPNGRTNTVGNVTTYSCDKGYTIVGINKRICVPNNTWTGSVPQCKAVNCGELSIVDGQVHSYSNEYGHEAVYVCNVGYRLKGNNKRTCQANAKWSGYTPQCSSVDCGNLYIHLGIVTTNYNTYSGKATYVCNQGYTLTGSKYRTCLASGLWSGTEPACALTDCGHLHVVFGTVQSNYNTYGGIAHYKCENGYKLKGNETRTCQDSGKWSNQPPICSPVDCGTLTLQFGRVIGQSNTFGETARYMCDLGYNLHGQDTRQCQADATWSGDKAVCIIVDCGPLKSDSIEHGKVSHSNTTYSSVVEYSCEVGYHLNGNTQRFCKADGTWSGIEPTCIVINCGVLADPSFGLVVAHNLTYGGEAVYKCNTGYDLVGSSVRTCQTDGKWSGIRPKCKAVDCGILESPVKGSVSSDKTSFEGEAKYSCDVGYKLTGSDMRVCQASGNWSGSKPHCTIVNCGSLPYPANGKVAVNKLTYGGKAVYTCNTGFKPSVDVIRTCQSDGTWDKIQPQCTVVNCGPPSNPSFGSVSTSSVTYGGKATYSCDIGYILKGNKVSVCQPYGQWSSVPPKCTVVYCDILPNPDGGSVSTDKRTFDGKAVYQCDPGYKLNGQSHRYCQANGSWTGVQPTCHLYGRASTLHAGGLFVLISFIILTLLCHDL